MLAKFQLKSIKPDFFTNFLKSSYLAPLPKMFSITVTLDLSISKKNGIISVVSSRSFYWYIEQ